MCESFFATLERELLDRRRFKTQIEAAHGSLRLYRRLVQSPSPPLGVDYHSPINYERI